MRRMILYFLAVALFLSACASSKEYFDKGMANFNSKQYAEAITNFTKAIELDPNYLDAFYYRGKSYSSLGEKRKASHDFLQYMKLTPESNYSSESGDSSTNNLLEYIDSMTTNPAITQ